MSIQDPTIFALKDLQSPRLTLDSLPHFDHFETEGLISYANYFEGLKNQVSLNIVISFLHSYRTMKYIWKQLSIIQKLSKIGLFNKRTKEILWIKSQRQNYTNIKLAYMIKVPVQYG